MNLPPEISFAPKEVQDHYRAMIEDGQSPMFAEMCALRQPPGTKGTDRTLMQGRYNGEWLSDMPPHQARRILRQAKEAGIDTTGKFYMSGLADKRSHMDPEAWIDSAADIKRVAEKRNLDVRGAVNYTATPTEPKSKKISKRAEERLIKAYMKKDSKLTRQEAREVVRQNHVPRWKK